MTYRSPSLQTLVFTGVVALAASALMALSRPIELRVDGQRVESDVPPITTSLDKVYVPVRAFTDALGAQLQTEGDRIYVIRGDQSLRMRIGDIHATLNGMPLTLTHAPFRVRGRAMVGLKTLARAMDVHVNYDVRTARIDVMTPGIGEASATSAPETQ